MSEAPSVHDVLVVGAGLAGMRAAIEAHNAGVSVALLSKLHPTRSHSAAAEGGINAPGNASEDDPEKHAFDTVKGSSHCQDKPRIVAPLTAKRPTASGLLLPVCPPPDRIVEKVAAPAIGKPGVRRCQEGARIKLPPELQDEGGVSPHRRAFMPTKAEITGADVGPALPTTDEVVTDHDDRAPTLRFLVSGVDRQTVAPRLSDRAGAAA